MIVSPDGASRWQRTIGGPGLSLLTFVGIWLAFSLANRTIIPMVNPMLLPTPMEVLQSGIDTARSGDLQRDIIASLSRVFEGFFLAAVGGVAMGMAVASLRPVALLAEPMIEMLRPIPPLAFLPMLVLWFGIGETSKVLFIAYAAFFPVFTTTLEGVKYVDPVLQRAAASLGATQAEVFRYVVLPAAMPAIITGLRLGFALSFFVIVAAEFIASDSGLGYLINDARTYFMVSQMLMGAIVIGIIGFFFNTLLRVLEARLLRWRTAVRG